MLAFKALYCSLSKQFVCQLPLSYFRYMTMANKCQRILIIDDDPDVLLTARMFLEQMDFHVGVQSDPEKVISRLKKESFDVILLDMNFTRGRTEGTEGLRWLERIKAQDPDVVIILMTAFGDVDLAVKGIRAGAMDFILKP